VVSLSISADGSVLASGSADGVIRLWALNGPLTGQQIDRFDLPGEGAPRVAFAPKGRLLAATEDSGGIYLLDTTSRATLWKKPADPLVLPPTWSPDGQTLAIAAVDGPVQFRRASTGAPLRFLGRKPLLCATFSPDGRHLASWEGSHITLWDTATGEQVRRLEEEDDNPAWGGASQMQFSPDGTFLLVGFGMGTVATWDMKTGKKTALYRHQGWVYTLAFSDDGRWAASGGADHLIRLWDLRDKRPVARPGLDGPIVSASVSPEGRTLATVTGAGTLGLWDLPNGKALPVPEGLQDRLWAIAFRPDGKTLGVVAGRSIRELQLRDRQTGKILSRGGDRPAVQNLAYSPDGTLVATVCEQPGEMAIRSGATCLVQAFGPRERFWGAVFAPDGRTMVGLGSPAAISLYDRSGRLRSSLPGHRGGLLAACYSPDGRLLISGGKDQVVRVWELASGDQRHILRQPRSWVCAVAVAPDNRTLACATVAGVIHLVDLISGQEVRQLAGHRGPITSLAFADQGRILTSTGQDALALLWDTKAVPHPVRPEKKLSAEDRDVLWQLLAGANARAAGQAIDELAADPAGTVAFLREQLQPVDGKKVTGYLADLEDDAYTKRERATNELTRFGPAIEVVLRDELKKKPALEKYRRIEQVLQRIYAGPSGDYLRALRAVEVVERIRTPEARRVLERLAGGMPEAELTQQARGALRRR
jgi:WD40 repeat protein